MDFNGKLENGVELYTSLNPALRGFCLSLWVRRGSMHDEHHGLAHMLEHVTFRCISERMGGRLYETLAGLGLDFDAISEAFAPYCTSIQAITTAESFDELG